MGLCTLLLAMMIGASGASATYSGTAAASCADRLRTDPVKGWVGTLVDEHSTNRYHAIWNLIPYNSKWAYTVTAEWHMLTTA